MLQWKDWKYLFIFFQAMWKACKLVGPKLKRLLSNLSLMLPKLLLDLKCINQIIQIGISLLHLRSKPIYFCKLMRSYRHQLHWIQHSQMNTSIYSRNLHSTYFLSRYNYKLDLQYRLWNHRILMTMVTRRARI